MHVVRLPVSKLSNSQGTAVKQLTSSCEAVVQQLHGELCVKLRVWEFVETKIALRERALVRGRVDVEWRGVWEGEILRDTGQCGGDKRGAK